MMSFGSIGSRKFKQTLAKFGLGPSIGDIRWSRLPESDFQEINGDSWVVYDDRNIAGTDLGDLLGLSNLDDFRGLFPRMANHGRNDGLENPDGTVLGDDQVDEFKSHRHRYHISGGSSPSEILAGAQNNNYQVDYTEYEGGNETRPKAKTLNCFIKINW